MDARTQTSRCRRHVRAAVLLEVVLSVAILSLTMMVLGAQFSIGLETAQLSQRQRQGLMLAESIVSQIEMGTLELDEDEFVGEFGSQYPGYAWRVTTESSPIEGMKLLTVSILAGLPDDEGGELVELENFEEVLSVRTLRAEHMPLDLEQFVAPDQQAEDLCDQLPPEFCELLNELGIDLNDFDIPKLIQQLDMESLLELLPMLPMLEQLPQGQMGGSLWDQIRQQIQAYQKSQQPSRDDDAEQDEGDEGAEEDTDQEESELEEDQPSDTKPRPGSTPIPTGGRRR